MTEEGFISRLASAGVFLRGMPLTERIRLLQGREYPELPAESATRAANLVARWRARANEHDRGAFDRILTAYGVDEPTLERVAGIRPQDVPQWSIFDLIPAVDLAKHPPEWPRNSSFARVCDPLIRSFLVKFHSTAADMCDRYPHILRDDPERIFKLFAPSLESRLHMLVRKGCVLELNVARLRKRLHGETPEARFEDFIQMLGTEAYQFEFLSEYAVVAWHAVSMARQWLCNATNLLSRLCTDFPAYKAIIFNGENPDSIESISWGAGDSHHGGQSVCIVTWSAGRKLVYKPNSLALSRAFAQFLEYINRPRLGLRLRCASVLDFGSYGWQKFVPHEACGSRKEVRRFYWRQGAFAAIFHLLNTHDLHHGNLIASGEYPIYVDCETLVRPVVEGQWGGSSALALALAPQLASSLDLLPRRVWSSRECEGVDLSGLGGAPGQILVYAILKADAPKTDQMHIVKGDLVIEAKQNLPRLGEDLITLTEEYKQAVLEGFEAGYTALLESRDRLWSYIKSFNDIPVRLVWRPTRLYAVLQDTSRHPDYMRDAMDQEIFLSSTLAYEKSVTSTQIASELRDMSGDDIPYFLVGFSSHEILGGFKFEVQLH